MHKTLKISLIFFLICLFFITRYYGIGDNFTLENLKDRSDELSRTVETNPLVSVLIFIGVYILVAGLSIPGASILTLGAGFLFGSIFGTIYTNIGATIGAIIVFFVSRAFLGSWVQKKYSKLLERFNSEFKKNGTNYLLSLRLIPAFPFWMVNLFAGLTKVKFRTYAWTTSVGILPGSFVYAYAGRQLSTIESAGDIFSGGIIIAFVLLGALAVLPVIIKRFVRNKHDT